MPAASECLFIGNLRLASLMVSSGLQSDLHKVAIYPSPLTGDAEVASAKVIGLVIHII